MYLRASLTAHVELGAGLSNDFLINTSSDVALAYNDLSINENMHALIAFRLLRKPSNNFLSEMPEDQYWLFRRIVIHIVLGTDMALHMDSVKVIPIV